MVDLRHGIVWEEAFPWPVRIDDVNGKYIQKHNGVLTMNRNGARSKTVVAYSIQNSAIASVLESQ